MKTSIIQLLDKMTPEDKKVMDQISMLGGLVSKGIVPKDTKMWSRFSPVATLFSSLLTFSDAEPFELYELVDEGETSFVMYNINTVAVGKLISDFPNPKIVRLTCLETMQATRGKGLGSELLAKYEEALNKKGISAVVLTANDQYDVEGYSKKLPAFYKSKGYIHIEELEYFKAFRKVDLPTVIEANMKYLGKTYTECAVDKLEQKQNNFPFAKRR